VGRQGHYAGAVSRLAAFALDVGAAWALYTLGVAAIEAAVRLLTRHSYSLYNHPTVSFVVLAVWSFLYFTYQWAVSGRTLGMAIMGLQVVTAEGGPITGRHAVRRTIGLGLTLLTLGIGFLGIVFQKERRALDDFVAGTAVVYGWDARAAHLRWLARSDVMPDGYRPRHAAGAAQAAEAAQASAVEVAPGAPGDQAALTNDSAAISR
jgi:uncharacterized RDD family membrane protein YckC